MNEDVVLYLRYSDKNQQELSIEGQLRECTAYCETRGFKIVGSYIDRALSGKYETRDEFQRMIRDAAGENFSFVVVYKLNRFFRNRTEAAIYRKELRQHGVRLLSATEQIPEGRGGIYYEAILEAEAEAYSLGLSEDTQRGMLDAALKCQVTGPLPMGYKSVPPSGNPKEKARIMEIDPAGAAVVRRAFEMYADGQSIAGICATFNNEGIRTHRGKPFQISFLTNLLQNIKYKGVYKYKNEILVEGGCPAIVDERLFEGVQQKLAITKKAPSRGKATAEFFLTSKLFCGHCSESMFGDSGTNKKGQRYYYYSCSGKRKKNTCSKSSVPKDLIENAVFNIALEQMTDVNIAQIGLDVEEVAHRESQNAQQIAELKKEIVRVEAELGNIGKAIAQGIITETTKEMLENTETYRRDLKAQIIQQQIIADTIVTAEGVAAFLKQFTKGNRYDINFKRKVFDILVREVYVFDGKGPNGGHLVIWCNIGKGIKVETNLAEAAKECSAQLQAGEPKRENRPLACSLFFTFCVEPGQRPCAYYSRAAA